MLSDQLLTQILEKFGDKAQKLELKPAQAAISIDAGSLLELVAYIKEDENIAINYLSSLSAVDYLEEGMEMVYHFCSTIKHHTLTVKVKLNREKPVVPTIIEFFPGVNWYEREAWELFGIDITGHPDLKTLLLPENWDKGWPMRRDWDDEDFVRFPEF